MENLGEGECEFEMDLDLRTANDAAIDAEGAALTSESGVKKNLQRMVSGLIRRDVYWNLLEKRK